MRMLCYSRRIRSYEIFINTTEVGVLKVARLQVNIRNVSEFDRDHNFVKDTKYKG